MHLDGFAKVYHRQIDLDRIAGDAPAMLPKTILPLVQNIKFRIQKRLSDRRQAADLFRFLGSPTLAALAFVFLTQLSHFDISDGGGPCAPSWPQYYHTPNQH